jgi:hypothetical protein
MHPAHVSKKPPLKEKTPTISKSCDIRRVLKNKGDTLGRLQKSAPPIVHNIFEGG